MLRPEEVPDVFESDGSWRDLYVLDTTAEDWKEMLRLVRDRKTIDHTLFINGQAAPLPPDPGQKEMFDDRALNSWQLEVNLDGLHLKCHFFTPNQIEFDLDPRELTENRFYELLEFIESLGRRLRRAVLLTPENRSHDPIVKYDPKHDRIVKVPEELRKRD